MITSSHKIDFMCFKNNIDRVGESRLNIYIHSIIHITYSLATIMQKSPRDFQKWISQCANALGPKLA
jgi:hypothetical protein